MNNDVNNPQQPRPGQGQQPPGQDEKEKHGVGEGQPKPGTGTEIPPIPDEVPKRDVERTPSNPQTQPNQGPEQGPKQEIPDKGESEENNDVEEKAFDKDLAVEDDRDTESLVDTRDRFPFPNK